MKQFDPYPSIGVSAPAPPERSPLEPGSSHKRRSDKWRADESKWKGQRRAIEQLELHPKNVKIPEPIV
jgi:hypothetical protein